MCGNETSLIEDKLIKTLLVLFYDNEKTEFSIDDFKFDFNQTKKKIK